MMWTVWLIIMAIINAFVLVFSIKAVANETGKNPLTRYVWLLMGLSLLWMASFALWRILS